jgi:hypothetical protein
VAISVLDARDSFAAPVRAPLRLVPALPAAPARRRLPVVVAVAALVSGLEAVALLAAGLTGFDRVMSSLHRPSGVVVALGLGLLATWVVLCAGGGVALLDASGGRLFRGVCAAELAIAAGVLGAACTTSLFAGAAVPVPAVALLSLALPAGKLLLAGAPATVQWIAQGPRPAEHRPDPVVRHRRLCTVTMVVIGLALGALALTGPVYQTTPGRTAAVVTGH